MNPLAAGTPGLTLPATAPAGGAPAELSELLANEAYGDEDVSEVIRPAAVLPEEAARAVLVEMALRDVRAGGVWSAEPTLWRRYDRAWQADGQPGAANLIGTLQVAYGTPTRYEITVFRVTVTRPGLQQGFSVESLCDEAFGFGGLTLASCPRASLSPPPKPFRMR